MTVIIIRENNITSIDPTNDPNAELLIASLPNPCLCNIAPSFTAGRELDSPGTPKRIAGTLPMYCVVLAKAT